MKTTRKSDAQSLPVGTGQRFRAIVVALRRRGARTPTALAAWIGRQKYGARAFARMAAEARRRALAKRLKSRK